MPADMPITTVSSYQLGDIAYTIQSKTSKLTPYEQSGGGGAGDDMDSRVSKIELHIEYIKRDVAELRADVKSIDNRLTKIETGISSLKTTFGFVGLVVSLVFGFCVYIFGSYVSKILDALNGLVFK